MASRISGTHLQKPQRRPQRTLQAHQPPHLDTLVATHPAKNEKGDYCTITLGKKTGPARADEKAHDDEKKTINHLTFDE